MPLARRRGAFSVAQQEDAAGTAPGVSDTKRPNRCRDHRTIAEEAIIVSHAVPTQRLVARCGRIGLPPAGRELSNASANDEIERSRGHLRQRVLRPAGRKSWRRRRYTFRRRGWPGSCTSHMQAVELRRQPQGREAKPSVAAAGPPLAAARIEHTCANGPPCACRLAAENRLLTPEPLPAMACSGCEACGRYSLHIP